MSTAEQSKPEESSSAWRAFIIWTAVGLGAGFIVTLTSGGIPEFTATYPRNPLVAMGGLLAEIFGAGSLLLVPGWIVIGLAAALQRRRKRNEIR